MSSWVTWMQGIGTVMQAGQIRQEGKQARMNARLLRENARTELSAAARDEEAQRRAARAAIGRQAAAQAEAGIGTSGTGGLLLEQSAVLAELDALNIRYGGELRSKGLLAESMSLRNRSKQSGLLAGAQLLTGFSRAFTNNRIAGG